MAAVLTAMFVERDYLREPRSVQDAGLLFILRAVHSNQLKARRRRRPNNHRHLTMIADLTGITDGSRGGGRRAKKTRKVRKAKRERRVAAGR